VLGGWGMLVSSPFGNWRHRGESNSKQGYHPALSSYALMVIA